MNKFLLAAVCIFVLAFVAVIAFSCVGGADLPDTDEEIIPPGTVEKPPETSVDTTEADTTEAETTTEPETTEAETTEAETTAAPKPQTPSTPSTGTKPQTPQKKPLSINFNSLKRSNPDIYAWLDIPGTRISYPVLQRAGDDSFYHRRNQYGGYDINGSLYTEDTYNGLDFNDPVTIIYGHNMRSGVMFGTLRSRFSNQAALAANPEIVIYLPDRELHYTVFAAVPFDNRHILYSHDFSNARTFRAFFKQIMSIRELNSVVAKGASVSSDDKVLILSTCTSTTDTNDQFRFLVCAKLTSTVQK